MDEPTKGIDVGAKQEFYQLIQEMSKKGVAILLVTSELSEVLGLSDRIIVFKQGQIVAEVDPNKVTEEAIMSMTLQEYRLKKKEKTIEDENTILKEDKR